MNRDNLYMRSRPAPAVAAVALACVLGAFVLPAAARALWIGVHGNRLVDRQGEAVRLLGTSRSGSEYSCQQGYGFFDGPSDAASVRTMKSWRINSVRLPLNETCWLGINRIDAGLGGDAYRAAIRAYVNRLERAGLYVVLDLHVAAPGIHQATGIIPMADADHAPDFWRSVASAYRDDRAVLFDLYNEPHDVGWACWEHGCEIDAPHVGRYRAAGMTELVEAVRSTGAEQPLLLGGIAYARRLDRWLAHLPPDPIRAEVASNHTYDFAACYSACRSDLTRIAAIHPVVTGEMGEGDCRHDYIDPYMRWADRHRVSYLAWAWDAHGGWTCRSGPSLISAYDGTPTGYGIGFREHLRTLAKKMRRPVDSRPRRSSRG
jgi:endoglucanase